MKSRRIRAAKVRRERGPRVVQPRRRRRFASATETARKLRDDLIGLIDPSRRCSCCQGTDRIEIDHVDGCTWDRRLVHSLPRVLRYYRERAAGVPLRLLCRSCSGRDGRLRWQGRPRWRGGRKISTRSKP